MKVGDSTGIILTEEVMTHLKVKTGDTLYLTEEPDNSYRLSAHNPEFGRQIVLAEVIMREDREILRTLGK